MQNNVPEHRREINALKAFPISTTNGTMPRRKSKLQLTVTLFKDTEAEVLLRNKQLTQLGIKKWVRKMTDWRAWKLKKRKLEILR